jgi:hypothetical protein
VNSRDIVSIEWVLNELSLSDMPLPQAISILLSYVSNNRLPLYFNGSLLGTDATNGYEVIENGPDDVTFLIANGESYWHDGTLRLLGGNHFYRDSQHFIDVIKYQFNDEDFYSTEETGMFLVPAILPFLSFHCLRNEVLDSKSNLTSTQTTRSALNSKPFKGDVGALKALALLAREKAETSPKFRTGQKVNASEFKKHILNLANEIIDRETHDPEGLLKSLDDKIKKVLKQYEINEIPSGRIKKP